MYIEYIVHRLYNNIPLILFDYVTLYVPTWLYCPPATYFDPNKNVKFSVFSCCILV